MGLVTAPGYPVLGEKMTTDTDQKYIDDLVTNSEETLALWSNEEKQTLFNHFFDSDNIYYFILSDT